MPLPAALVAAAIGVGAVGAVGGTLRTLFGKPKDRSTLGHLEDVWGVKSLVTMPAAIVSGLYNAFKDPGVGGPLLAKGIYSSVLNLANTATLGVLDKPLEAIAPKEFKEHIDPIYRRKGGILPAFVEDVGTVALVGGVGKVATAARAGSAAKRVADAATAAKTAQEAVKLAKLSAEPAAVSGRAAENLFKAGKLFTADPQTAKAAIMAEKVRSALAVQAADDAARAASAKLADAKSVYGARVATAEKWDRVAHPYRTVFRKVVRPLTSAAHRQVIASIRDTRGSWVPYAAAAAEAATKVDEATPAGSRPLSGVEHVAPQSAEDVARMTPFERGPVETHPKQLSFDLGEAAEALSPDEQIRRRNQLLREHLEEQRRMSMESEAAAKAEPGPTAKGDPMHPEAPPKGAKEIKGDPFMETPQRRLMQGRLFDEDGTPSLAVTGRVGVPGPDTPITWIHRLWDKLIQEKIEKQGIVYKTKRVWEGTKRVDVETMDLPKSIEFLDWMERRFQRGDIIREIRTQQRLATAAARRTLASSAVQKAVRAAERLVEDLGLTRHEASVLVGDEIRARLTGLRALADEIGIPEDALQRLNIKRAALPEELTNNPDLWAKWNQLVNDATTEWVKARGEALEQLRMTRYKEIGLQNIDLNEVILSKGELRLARQGRRHIEKMLRLEGRFERERFRAQRKLTSYGDELQKEAIQLAAKQKKLGETRGTATFSLGPDTPAVWTPKMAAQWDEHLDMLANEALEHGGFSYDPRSGKILRHAGDHPQGDYVVAIIPGVEGIPVGELTKESLRGLIDATAKLYSDLWHGRGDVVLGGWLDKDTGLLYIEPSQVVKNEAYARLLGRARAQKSIAKLTDTDPEFFSTDFGVPGVAAQFVGTRVDQLGETVDAAYWRNRFANSVFHAIEKGYPWTANEADTMMAYFETLAVGWSNNTGLHPDDFFQQLELKFHETWMLEAGVLAHDVKRLTPNMRADVNRIMARITRLPDEMKKMVVGQGDLEAYRLAVEEMYGSIPLFQFVQAQPLTVPAIKRMMADLKQFDLDVGVVMDWYYRSHEEVIKPLHANTIRLGNGAEVSEAQIFAELLAVTSVNASPYSNFVKAAKALREFRELWDQGQWQAMIDEYNSVYEKGGDLRKTALYNHFETVGKARKVGHLNDAMLFDIAEILSGRTMLAHGEWKGWTNEYIRGRIERGMRTSDKRLVSFEEIDDFGLVSQTPDQYRAWLLERFRRLYPDYDDVQLMEAVETAWNGDNAAMKMRSFAHNLLHPEDSWLTTIDRWHMVARSGAPDIGLIPGAPITKDIAGKWVLDVNRRAAVVDELLRVREFIPELQAAGIPVTMPHQVQALLWVWAKVENWKFEASFRSSLALRTLEEFLNGTWDPNNDSVLRLLEEIVEQHYEGGRPPLPETKGLSAQQLKQLGAARRTHLVFKRKVPMMGEPSRMRPERATQLQQIIQTGSPEEIKAALAQVGEREVTMGIPISRMETSTKYWLEGWRRIHAKLRKLHEKRAKGQPIEPNELAAIRTSMQAWAVKTASPDLGLDFADVLNEVRAGKQNELAQVLDDLAQTKGPGPTWLRQAFTSPTAPMSLDDVVKAVIQENQGLRLNAGIDAIVHGYMAPTPIRHQTLATRRPPLTEEAKAIATAAGEFTVGALEINLFKSADHLTLIHEVTHALRYLMAPEDVERLARHYSKYIKGNLSAQQRRALRFAPMREAAAPQGRLHMLADMPYGQWLEEMFVNDFLEILLTKRIPRSWKADPGAMAMWERVFGKAGMVLAQYIAGTPRQFLERYGHALQNTTGTLQDQLLSVLNVMEDNMEKAKGVAPVLRRYLDGQPSTIDPRQLLGIPDLEQKRFVQAMLNDEKLAKKLASPPPGPKSAAARTRARRGPKSPSALAKEYVDSLQPHETYDIGRRAGVVAEQRARLQREIRAHKARVAQLERDKANLEIQLQRADELHQRLKFGTARTLDEAVDLAAQEMDEGRRAHIEPGLIDGRLFPSLKARIKANNQLVTMHKKLQASIFNASVQRTPPRWQPLHDAVIKLVEEAQSDPVLAQQLAEAGIDRSLGTVVAWAVERGLNPVHVSEFSPELVRHLVFTTLRLGRPNRRLGEQMLAHSRIARKFVKPNLSNSIEALAASINDVIWETHTAAVIDAIEDNFAVKVAPGTPIPKGWTAWDPVKRSWLEDVVETGPLGQHLRQTSAQAQWIVPDSVAVTLRKWTSDFSHPLLSMIQRITNPWRTLVLLLSPRWYVNNAFGNLMLASVQERARLSDWRRAWHLVKTRRLAEELPEIAGASLVSDLMEEQSLVPLPQGPRNIKKAMAQAKREGGLSMQVRHAGHMLRRANEVVDEMARAAAFFARKRRIAAQEAKGITAVVREAIEGPERGVKGAGTEMYAKVRGVGKIDPRDLEAMNAAIESLIDYRALSPLEQQVIRSVVPFYAWQKGILKVAVRFPNDHPYLTYLAFRLQELNEQLMLDRFGYVLPEAYRGLIVLPNGTMINTRGLNPFQDAGQLTSPQGIVESLNPFVQIILRKGTYSPEFGEGQPVLDPYGYTRQDVNLQAATAGLLMGLPQARVAGAGPGKYGQAHRVGQFFGVSMVPEAQMDKIMERVRRFYGAPPTRTRKRPPFSLTASRPRNPYKALLRGVRTRKPGQFTLV